MRVSFGVSRARRRSVLDLRGAGRGGPCSGTCHASYPCRSFFFCCRPLRHQEPTHAAPAAVTAEIREATRRYDDAIRRSDAAAVERAVLGPRVHLVWNPGASAVTRADRMANLRATRTAFDSLAHAPEDERVRRVRKRRRGGVHRALLADGRPGGRGPQRRGPLSRVGRLGPPREGRWQQLSESTRPRCSLAEAVAWCWRTRSSTSAD